MAFLTARPAAHFRAVRPRMSTQSVSTPCDNISLTTPCVNNSEGEEGRSEGEADDSKCE